MGNGFDAYLTGRYNRWAPVTAAGVDYAAPRGSSVLVSKPPA
jgi:hypothetical protein